MLVISNPASPQGSMSSVNELGYLKAISEPWVKTFSLDVGFNRGQTSLGWLKNLKSLFVIGVDANHLLVSRFEHSEEFEEIREKEIVLLGAVGTKYGTAMFNPGFGWDNVSDTGSLFGWADPERERERRKYLRRQMPVRFLRLQDILEHVPPPRLGQGFLWDTLKIDVQGADVDALISAGEYIKRFLCVVGEFQTQFYSVPKEIPTDPAPFLKQNGFVRVHYKETDNQIWMNPIYFEEYRKNATIFGCHLVYDSVLDPVSLVTAYDKGGV
jgi:hypothetical protein